MGEILRRAMCAANLRVYRGFCGGDADTLYEDGRSVYAHL